MSDLGRSILSRFDAEDFAVLADRLGPYLATGSSRPSLALVPVVEPGRLLTTTEAADRAGVHVETIRRAVRSGALTASRAGRAVRINPDDLTTWLAASRAVERNQPRQRPRRQSARSPMADALARLDKAASNS